MEKIFNLTSTFKTHAEEDGSVMIRGMASTVDFDRAGDSISSEAWQKGGMANFEKNPIILFNHDYDKPIGRATGLKAGPNGLEMEAKISKHAHCAALIKDGVLGAFSVGFRVKDADYIKETDGLMIKDAELFEVSVVSVPCNQSATFSLAKSFDSTEEYEEFKKTFTNRVDLAGQSLAKDEDISSSIASDTPKSAEQSAEQEIKMSEGTKTPEIDLEAFAKKVAEETAAKIAMQQAETKAAEKAEAEKAAAEAEAKALEGEHIQATIRSGIETGAEKLLSDVQKEMDAAKSDQIDEITKKYEADLKEKADEIEAMRNSKKSFEDRGSSDLTPFGRELLGASLLGKIQGKAISDTAYGRKILEKAGVNAGSLTNSTATSIDQIVQTTFEEDVRLEMQVAGLFDELTVTSGSTVLPIARDPVGAKFGSQMGLGADAANGQIGTSANADEYRLEETVVRAYRLLAGTSISNDLDEQVVVSILPILGRQLARAHAKAVDTGILTGVGTNAWRQGLTGGDGTDAIGSGASAALATANATAMQYSDGGAANAGILSTVSGSGPTAANLLKLRAQMGAYGYNPADVVFIVPLDVYYDMVDGSGFSDISEVGSDTATKLTGVVGSVFGSRVVATNILGDKIAGTAGVATTAALAVAPQDFVIPRLSGVSIETEYSVVNQKTSLVASQSLGFNQLIGGGSAIRLSYRAS